MKNNNIHKSTEDNENLKSALLKILLDLNVELPENLIYINTNNSEEKNIEPNNIEEKNNNKKQEKAENPL